MQIHSNTSSRSSSRCVMNRKYIREDSSHRRFIAADENRDMLEKFQSLNNEKCAIDDGASATTCHENRSMKNNYSSIKKNLRKLASRHKDDASKLGCHDNDDIRNIENRLRGGAPGINTSNTAYSELIEKFYQYRNKILNDSEIAKELSLYIEPRVRSGTADNETIELAFEIHKKFLNCEGDSEGTPKVFLITGQAGIGKSLFCKQLHRDLITNWKNIQGQETEEGNWFPVYIEFSMLEESKSEAIAKTLMKELSLTREEVLMLQSSAEESSMLLPKLLFIFDGYDDIENIQQFHSFGNEEDYLKNNFCLLNMIEGKSWKNAKIIITCREENLQGIEKRELLFGPLQKQSLELLPVPGTFLQRKIEPFTDEQITCYIKKYYISKQPSSFEENQRNVFKNESMAMSQSSSSWQEVKKFEKTIDYFKSREIARIPCLLQIMVEVLPSLVEKNPDPSSNLDPIQQPNLLTARRTIKCFVNQRMIAQRTIPASGNLDKGKEESKHQEEIMQRESTENSLPKKLAQHVQDFALNLHSYSKNFLTFGLAKNYDELLAIELSHLLKWNSTWSKFNFRHPLLLEYFVAKHIEEEIITLADLKKGRNSKAPNDFLFNQRLLVNEASYSPIVFFLRDAIHEKRLSSEQLLNVIRLSSSKDSSINDTPLSLQESEHTKLLSPFTVAAVNAITILNFSGYDFKNQDLSNTCLVGANLSCGNFEGTNFMNSNLKDVNFSDSYLNDAIFVNANMENVRFDEFLSLSLKLTDDVIIDYGFSPNEEYLGIRAKNHAFVYQLQFNNKTTGLKLLAKLPGMLPDNNYCSFRKDGKHVVTQIDSQLIVWDVYSHCEIKRVELPQGYFRFVHFNSESDELIFFNIDTIQKYKITSEKWISLNVAKQNIYIEPGIDIRRLGKNEIMLISFWGGMFLMNSLTGKVLLKNTFKVHYCRFSIDGKQIVANQRFEHTQISDCVRGHPIKLIPLKIKEHENSGISHLEQIKKCSLTMEGKLITSTYTGYFIVQDAASSIIEKAVHIPLINRESRETFSSNGKYATATESIGLIKIRQLSDSCDKVVPLRGSHSKGLSIKGTVINSAAGLSEENIALFQIKGDYREIPEDRLRKVYLIPSANATSISQVNLAHGRMPSHEAKIIGKDLLWINLKKLDLTGNLILGADYEAIAKNQSWPHLEELILRNTRIDDNTAIMMAKNETWKNLKKLDLSLNSIKPSGGIAIGKNNIWVKLEELNLNGNVIQDEGATSIGENVCWKNLKELDLGMNKIGNKGAKSLANNTAWPCLEYINLGYNSITDANVVISICSNTTWVNLKTLRLLDNPVELQAKDMSLSIEGIASNSLQLLNFPRVEFNSELLHLLKRQENVVNFILSDHKYTYDQLEVISHNTKWIDLKKLCLSNKLLKDDIGVAIGSNTAWNNLEELDLNRNVLTKVSGIAIGNNKAWSKLVVLNLRGNKIGVEGGSLLGANATWSNLRVLNLRDNQIGDEGAIALSKNTAWTNLQELFLSNNKITFVGAAALSKYTIWSHLQRLNLGGNKLDDLGVIELSKNTTWKELRELLLFSNSISSKGMVELCKNTTWTKLHTLILSDNLIDAEGIAALNKNQSWSSLKLLNLGNNKLGDEGAIELSRNVTLTKLQILILVHNGKLGNKGASALIKNNTWAALKELHLNDNEIEHEGIAGLSDNISWINLHTLNLGGTAIGPKGAAELGKNKSWLNLQILNLSDTSIGSKGAIEIAKNSAWTNLRKLNLCHNEIGDEAVAELSNNKTWIHLQDLYLSGNLISSKGIAELSRNSTWTNLRILNLANNMIDEKGVAYLKKNTTWTKLENINLCYNSLKIWEILSLAENPIWKNLKISPRGLFS